MDRNIGEPLTKAFEAYRQACFEKEAVKKELKVKTEAYESQISELKQQLEDKNKLIAKLVQQSPVIKGNTKGSDTVMDCQKTFVLGSVSPCPQNESQITITQREKQLMDQLDDIQKREKKQKHIISIKDEEIRNLQQQLKETCILTKPCCSSQTECGSEVNWKTPDPEMKKTLHFSSTGIAKDERPELFDALNEVQSKLHILQNLTRKQKEHLNKLWFKNESIHEGQFSMPIQCTDVTAEQAEGPFHTSKKQDMDKEQNNTSITSRGVCPDEEFMDSLSKISVKYPPKETDYEFLNSTQEKVEASEIGNTDPFEIFKKDRDEAAHFEEAQNWGHLPSHKPNTALPNVNKDFLTPPPPSSSSSTVLTHLSVESVRGPEQPFWSPQHSREKELLQEGFTDTEQNASPNRCEFCQALLPAGIQSNMELLRHLNSHFVDSATKGV
ncbi:TRAF family member-associated NF-kappa-B activator isoform X1 [Polypterus senegalus]